MPIFKAGNKLVYYAHVPKCAGSSVNWYLKQRFGDLAFSDSNYTKVAPPLRWTRTSPQHVDCQNLERLFPAGFFDAAFTIVRHPVSRLVSAYHFQREVEMSVPEDIGFSEWLGDLTERRAEDPFVFDNHVRPMTEIVPEGAKVFHVEHGLDSIIPWFDQLTGAQDAPRALPKINEQGQYAGTSQKKAKPNDADLALIATLYGEDLERFGYQLTEKAPLAPAPVLSDTQKQEIEAASKAMNSTMARVKRGLSKLTR